MNISIRIVTNVHIYTYKSIHIYVQVDMYICTFKYVYLNSRTYTSCKVSKILTIYLPEAQYL